MTQQRLFKLLIIFAAAIFIAGVISYGQIKGEAENNGNNVVVSNFGGPFTLTNQDGETVTEKDFEGQYRLIYFGFTYCPAICPTELQRITTVLKSLGETGDPIQPIFITVDPERDTADVIKTYISAFHPRFIGLTGTPAQTETVKKAYKIYSAKVQDDTMSDYTVDHSSFIYFMAPNNDLLRIFKMDDPVEKIEKDIRDIFGEINPQ